MPPAVRDATEGDAVAVARLLTELGYPCPGDEAAAHIRRYADQPASRVQVAERDRAVVGLLGFRSRSRAFTKLRE